MRFGRQHMERVENVERHAIYQQKTEEEIKEEERKFHENEQRRRENEKRRLREIEEDMAKNKKPIMHNGYITYVYALNGVKYILDEANNIIGIM